MDANIAKLKEDHSRYLQRLALATERGDDSEMKRIRRNLNSVISQATDLTGQNFDRGSNNSTRFGGHGTSGRGGGRSNPDPGTVLIPGIGEVDTNGNVNTEQTGYRFSDLAAQLREGFARWRAEHGSRIDALPRDVSNGAAINPFTASNPKSSDTARFEVMDAMFRGAVQGPKLPQNVDIPALGPSLDFSDLAPIQGETGASLPPGQDIRTYLDRLNARDQTVLNPAIRDIRLRNPFLGAPPNAVGSGPR